MKKYLFWLILTFMVCFAPHLYAASYLRGAVALTGGTTGCLDAIDGDELSGSDLAFVGTSTTFYVYYLDASSGAAESSPDIIAPDDNAGDKRWILIAQGDAETADIAALAVTDGNFIVGDGTTWVAESGATARTSMGVGTTDSPTFAGETLTGNQTITKADPAIILDSATATDTDFWMGVTEDAGGDDDDKFQIGDGATPGTNPFVTVLTDGKVGIGTASPTTTFAVVGGQSVKKTNVADTNYDTSALTSDYIIAWSSLSASRTATISTEDIQSGTTTQPRVMIFKDESGSATTYPISIVLENGSTIDGQAAYSINQAYGSVTIYLNGTNGFCY